MRVAIYARVSTREQAEEGYSIAAQLKSLKAFCVSQNWDIVGVYTDEGISAKDTNRPHLKRMIKDVKGDKVDVVLVYRLDRLTRSVLDLYKLLDTFDKNDCGFKSATEVYDTTTAMGRLFITIVAALAQWERENLGERVSMGMLEKARQKLFPGGRVPFGFRLVDDGLVINETEAKTVRLIYELYIEGNGMSKVAEILNNKNIRTRSGTKFYKSTIDTILKSSFVRGSIERGGEVIEDAHDAIIDNDIAAEVERTLYSRTNHIKTSSLSSDYLFSGVIQCFECGANLHGSSTKRNNKTYYTYRCPNRKLGECDGENTTASETQIEQQFLERLKSVDVSNVASDVELELEKNDDGDGLLKELSAIEKRKKKWQFAWMEDFITDDDLKERMKEESEKEKEVMLMMESVEKEPVIKYDEEEIKEMLINVQKNWNAMDRIDKKRLIQSIIKKVSYRKDKRNVVVTDIELVV